MKQIHLTVTDEMFRVIEHARGDSPRSPWIETEFGKLPSIKKAARELGIVLPKRDADARGGDRRGK